MIIGINATAAIKQPRTGVEEYAYRLIKHLTMLPEAGKHRFLLYLPAETRRAEAGVPFDFPLPPNFEIKILKWPLPMWTQLRLASEMAFNKPDALFIPAHILPAVHPGNSVVTIHGLEYEYFPQYYPFHSRKYLRWSTKYALKHARKIIAISDKTKNDLVKLYGADDGKIEVIYHGAKNSSLQSSLDSGKGSLRKEREEFNLPYLFYIGRVELKKNILGILKAYEILKEKYKIPHELVLAGEPGYGYEKIKAEIEALRLRSGCRVKESGYLSEDDKWKRLSGADVFVFPSFYEGFGIPILEAQMAGTPVVTADNSCLPEIAGRGALYAEATDPDQIAQVVYKSIDDKHLRDKLIQLGFENAKRFSWEKCASETLKVILD
ncbi:MAG: glycosyltransferase family 1 protein [Candidatus Portnoybacteria bacterium]|nr:glycosyltransferase family 1 protein [Candidatus Portnoybacteria bacterium]